MNISDRLLKEQIKAHEKNVQALCKCPKDQPKGLVEKLLGSKEEPVKPVLCAHCSHLAGLKAELAKRAK